MSVITNVLLVCVLCVVLNSAEDLVVGSSLGAQLGYQESVRLSSIPLSTRTKNVFYNSNNTRTIKAVSAVDIDKTEAKPIITAGGVGATFVNLRIRSERGEGLNYLVQIFV